MTLLAVALAVGGAALIAAGPAATGSAGAAAAPKPNILVIETDDQTVESVRVMTNVRDLLARQGTTFSNSFVANALCCPSRATFLTGQYSHSNGVWTNNLPNGGYQKLDHSNTLAVWLQRAGYHTAHLGKYLNGYRTRGTPPTEVPPGWSEWHGSVDPTTYRFWDYTLNENGKLVTFGNRPADYQADVYAQKGSEIIGRLAASERPFFLWAAFLAPHSGQPRTAGDPPNQATPEPAPRHRDRFASEPFPTPPSFNEQDVSDKPQTIQRRPVLTQARAAGVAENYRQRLESLLAVDEAVAAFVSRLRAAGELDDTLIVFTSDNGFMHGEHRIPSGKVVVYEPSIRVPLIMRGPGIPRNRIIDDPVLNVDLAPTMLDAADAKASRVLDGTSLLPLARDPLTELGRDVLLETPSYAAIRTPRYKYVEYTSGDRELYDLVTDPHELSSRHADSALGGVRTELARRLAELRRCSGATCRRGPRLQLQLASGGRAVTARRCVRSSVRASLAGADLRAVGRVDFYVSSRRVALDGRSPFRATLSRAAVRRGTVRLRARVSLNDQRRVTIDRTFRVC